MASFMWKKNCRKNRFPIARQQNDPSYRLTATLSDRRRTMAKEHSPNRGRGPAHTSPKLAVGEPVLRMAQVRFQLGDISRATVYRLYGHARIKLGPNITVWTQSYIDSVKQEAIDAAPAAAAAE